MSLALSLRQEVSSVYYDSRLMEYPASSLSKYLHRFPECQAAMLHSLISCSAYAHRKLVESEDSAFRNTLIKLAAFFTYSL